MSLLSRLADAAEAQAGVANGGTMLRRAALALEAIGGNTRQGLTWSQRIKQACRDIADASAVTDFTPFVEAAENLDINAGTSPKIVAVAIERMINAMPNVGGSQPSWWDDTVLSLEFDTDSFVDGSSLENTVAKVGSPLSDSVVKKYGDGSLDCSNNSANYLSIEDRSEFVMNGELTIACWARPDASGFSGILEMGTFQNSGILLWGVNNQAQVTWGTSSLESTVGGFPYNQWSHLAVTRDASNNMRLFVNGVVVGTRASSTQTIDPQTITVVGGHNTTTNRGMKGNCDSLLVVNGTCLWTEDFTPPTGPHNEAGSYS